MSVIEAASVSIKTMADGTLRIACDVEPRHAQDAFKLFGSPGTAMALAALSTEYPGELTPPKRKGGELCKWAGMLCADISFRQWVANREDLDIALDEEACAEVVRRRCEITSRVELDYDAVAAERFIGMFKLPYLRYMALATPAKTVNS